MRVPALAAWDVEYTRSRRQAEQVDEAPGFLAVALGGEEEVVLE